MTEPLARNAGDQHARTRDESFIRPLAFSEAFKFTPLTTSPLQPSDQIPLPSVGASGRDLRLASQSERKAVASIKITSDVQDQLQRLLQPRDLSEFKFKRKPNTRQPPSQPPKLSPLANHVYNCGPLDYKYQPEPVSSSTHPATFTATAEQLNGSAHAQNFVLEVPAAQKSSSDGLLPVVAVPQPAGFRREDYAAVPDSPKRRKLQNEDREAQLALRQRTQREQGDAAVLQFQNYLLTLLEVRDRLEEDDSNDAATSSNGLFESSNDDDDFKIQLSATTLSRLQSRLQELVDLKRLDDISNEHINALRHLCEGPVARSQTLNLRLSQDPSDEDIEIWHSRIASAEIGAASASVTLLTTLGDNTPDLSPDVLQAVSGLLVNAFESCLIPVIESRPDGQSGRLFSCAVAAETGLKSLLDASRKLLDQLVTACVQIKVDGDCLNTTEFLAAKLIFVQNGPTEKVAALGSKTYERARKQVMSALARLFAAFPSDRKTVMDEILSSVDKLPSTSRSARQYTLGDGKSIMLVTALFVQLVQTSALDVNRRSASLRLQGAKQGAVGDEVSAAEDDDEGEEMHVDDPEEAQDELSRLRRKAEALYTPTLRTSHEIVLYLVNKASKVSKTGDSPYRNILDLFIEDLVILLPLPDWPASQLVLDLLFKKMADTAQTEKAAGVKNMALESLGTMGAAIASCKASAVAHAAGLARDADGASTVAQSVVRLANDHFSRGLTKEELLGPEGPFALTCRYYDMQQSKRESKSLRARSAQCFYLAQYATAFCRNITAEPGEELGQSLRSEAAELLEEIDNAASEAPPVGILDNLQPREALLAYLLSILSHSFCRRYEAIAHILLASLSSEQAQVRSRSIKSVVTMLETDASLLDSQDMKIERYIFPCASDDSALVRDAALSLIAKFLISKPVYEERGIKKLIECTRDGKVGVQKRSISHLADIYAQESRPQLKAWIAETFLRRTGDLEDSVSDLAKRTLSDAWFSGNLALASEPQDSAKANVAIEQLTADIVATIEYNATELQPLFTRFIIWQLKANKAASQLGALLNRIVAILFGSIVAGNAKEASLTLLVCLAQARPEAVAPAQLSHLRQYLTHLTTTEELPMFKAVIGIFRHVLPRLSVTHQDLLLDIQGDLFSSVTKLRVRGDLDDVMSCLRTIDDVLHNGARFVKLLKSIIDQLSGNRGNDATRKRLVFIVGSLTKHIDVDSLQIHGQISAYHGGSVSGFIADLLYPFAARDEPDEIQLTALDSLGCVCQAWPAQFEKEPIRKLFYNSLGQADGSKARRCVLKTFEEMFVALGDPPEEDASEKAKGEPAQDLKKMGGNAKLQSNNSAISNIAQHVFGRIAKIALSTTGPDLIHAARTVAIMSKRGMFHPKDYAGVFIALETCDDAEVRSIAEQAHAKAHTQHESFWEREYMQAVQTAFKYQLQTVQDASGTRQGKAKLGACFSIINTSGSKYVKKFLSNLISRLSTDVWKLEIARQIPNHILFVRFVAQNLAFFEFAKMEDLLHTILQLELVFGKNGSEISEAIETRLPVDPPPRTTETVDVNGVAGQPENNNSVGDADQAIQDRPTPVTVADADLVKRLAAGACAVTIISEARSHLKRQYGISRDVRATMHQNKQAKEGGKAPLKVHGITGDRFLQNTNGILSSMETQEAMLGRCREFHGLMNIDEDVVVGEEGMDMREGHSASVDPDGLMAPGNRGKKRKSTGSVGGTPRKRGRPRKNTTPTRRSSSVSSRDDPEADFMG